MRRMLVAAGIVALVATACTGASDSEGAAGEGPEPPAPEVEGAPGGSVGDGAADAGGVTGGDVGALGGVPLPNLGSSVIKTADLRLEVERGGFKEAVQGATSVASGYGGFLVSSTLGGEEARHGSLVIRVPSRDFERALIDLRGLGEVQRETISGEDVGQEFVDLEARLRNLEAQERVLLRLMDRATSVSDTIRVQRELSTVQLEIERIRGRLAYLEDRTAFGTISVDLFEPGVAPPGSPGTLGRALEQAREVFMEIVGGLIVAMGALVPVGLLAGAGWFAFRRLRPRPAASRHP